MELWHKEKFEELCVKDEIIQASLKTIQKPSSLAEMSKKFKQYMTKGNINSALNLLTNNMENGKLQLNNDTLSKFIQKHPNSKAASQDILLNDPLQNIYPVKFQSIGEETIRKAAIRIKGGSGQSCMDVDG